VSRDDQETRESPALNPQEVQFSREDAESIGDPAAGGMGAEDTSAPAIGDSPAAAQARAEGGDTSPLERPEVQVLGAFIGAFVVAKLLQRLFSRD
jgi:hypothetical protein